MKTNRNKLIGIIHMQRNALGINEEEYKSMVLSVSGKNSCAECSESEPKNIFRQMNSLLQKSNKKPFYFRPFGSSMHAAVIACARKKFGDNWEERLVGFLKHINKNSLDSCSQNDLRKIMGFINRARKE